MNKGECIEQSFDKKRVFSEEKTSFLKQLLRSSKESMPPSFILLGAQKAGTSSLAFQLSKHPNITPPKQKEIYYFNNSNFYKKGKQWYLSHFSENKEGEITFDATANYFESFDAAIRIKKKYPGIKFILLMRNPIDRAFSHYKMAVRMGFEKLSFAEALELESDRLSHSGKYYVPQYGHDYVFQRLAYRTKGVYVRYLKKWLEHFSRDQFLIIQSELYFKEPNPVYQSVLEHLELPTFSPAQFEKINAGNNQKPDVEIRKQLKQFYEPWNEELFQLLGEKYDWN